MHLAIVDDNDKIFVEYDALVFKKLLVKYFDESRDLEEAFDRVCEDLKNLTRIR